MHIRVIILYEWCYAVYIIVISVRLFTEESLGSKDMWLWTTVVVGEDNITCAVVVVGRFHQREWRWWKWLTSRLVQCEGRREERESKAVKVKPPILPSSALTARACRAYYSRFKRQDFMEGNILNRAIRTALLSNVCQHETLLTINDWDKVEMINSVLCGILVMILTMVYPKSLTDVRICN